MSKTRKKDRTNTLALASVTGCFFFAYGFSNHNALFQWKLPLAIMIVTALWVFLPKLARRNETRESA